MLLFCFRLIFIVGTKIFGDTKKMREDEIEDFMHAFLEYQIRIMIGGECSSLGRERGG